MPARRHPAGARRRGPARPLPARGGVRRVAQTTKTRLADEGPESRLNLRLTGFSRQDAAVDDIVPPTRARLPSGGAGARSCTRPRPLRGSRRCPRCSAQVEGRVPPAGEGFCPRLGRRRPVLPICWRTTGHFVFPHRQPRKTMVVDLFRARLHGLRRVERGDFAETYAYYPRPGILQRESVKHAMRALPSGNRTR
jgi:hypothetical protein